MLMPPLCREACTSVPKRRFKAARLLSAGFLAAERIADNFTDREKRSPPDRAIRRAPGLAGSGGYQTARFIHTALGSVKLSIAAVPCSRPRPESRSPPQGRRTSV